MEVKPMVKLTKEKYEVLVTKYHQWPKGECMHLHAGRTTPLPDYPDENAMLVRKGYVKLEGSDEIDAEPEAKPEGDSDEESPSPLHDVSEPEDADDGEEEVKEDALPDQYGKDIYPCKNPECPAGRNEGAEPGPYKRERDLARHLKSNPECAGFVKARTDVIR
jgi:hypothetical protein